MQPNPLSPIGGEFASSEREAAFQAERLPETIRHARLLFLLSAILNTLFLLSDWRFFGQDHFYLAIPARSVVVAVSLACLFAVGRSRTFDQAQGAMIAWEWINGAAVAVLVSSRSDIALFVVVMLPSIYYLVVPTSFRWTILSGAGCSTMMLAGYTAPGSPSSTSVGLVLAMVMLNVALILVVARSNRLRRLEWAATQSERRAKEELAESRRIFEKMFMTVPIPLLVTAKADGRVMNANEAAIGFFGGGPDALDLPDLAQVHVDPMERTALLAALERDGRVNDFEASIRLADGSVRNVLLAASATEIGGTESVMAGVVDITNRKAIEERVWRAASHDALTGLPNRALFQSRLEQALVDAERIGGSVSLILIDLDEFKEVNDTLGHDAGDALLRQTADRLRGLVRDCDTVARLGGDEFVVLIVEPLRLQDAVDLAERIVEEMREPFFYKDRMLSSRVSIGVAAFPDHDREAVELMKDADLALYAAKTQGRNRVAIYSPAMRHAMERRVTVARDLRTAISHDLIAPFYQPKVCLATGRIVGFEALARWQHPMYGLLTPRAFASAFEDVELALRIGEQMVNTIARDLRGWLREGLDCGRVAVNLSAAEFSEPGLAERILASLSAAGVPADRLAIEVTETVFLGRSSDHVSTILERFHAEGVRIALDDFGTGYASLTHLKQFPVDDIKIDQSFVRDIERDADDAAIVSAVIELGKSLGMQVVAEGVETPWQARYLRDRGCHYAQGFLYAKPMAASRVPWFLSNAGRFIAAPPAADAVPLRA